MLAKMCLKTLAFGLFLTLTANVWADDSTVEFVDLVERPDLRSVVSTRVSADGKFLYAAAWGADSIIGFSRDRETGKLEHLQTVKDLTLNGAVCFRLNSEETYGAATSFQAATVALFGRDAKTGKLKKLDAFKGPLGRGNKKLTFPVECLFSSDSRFLFVADSGAIVVLKITEDGKLEFVERNVGRAQSFADTRGLALRPGKNQFFATSGQGHNVSLVEWNEETGKLSVKEQVKDERDGVKGLRGVMSLTVSIDGRFLYTSSGRFRGDNSIGVFEIAEDGKMKVVQELNPVKDDIGRFSGGNEIVVSDDQKNVYVTGTTSATMTALSRDPNTGKLTYTDTVSFDSEVPGITKPLGPAGIAVSPDDKHIYVAVEGFSAIAILSREPDE